MTERLERPKEVCGGVLIDCLIYRERRINAAGEIETTVLSLFVDDDGHVIDWPLPPHWRAHLITGYETNGWPK